MSVDLLADYKSTNNYYIDLWFQLSLDKNVEDYFVNCLAAHESALQIFQKESHPSVYKMGAGNSGAKEGLSLFGN